MRAPAPQESTRPALFTALRTGFAEGLLRRAFEATRKLRAERRLALGAAPGETPRGLGTLLVVAPDQTQARRYLEIRKRPLRALLPLAGVNVLGRSGARSFRTTLWIALTTTRRVSGIAGLRF